MTIHLAPRVIPQAKSVHAASHVRFCSTTEPEPSAPNERAPEKPEAAPQEPGFFRQITDLLVKGITGFVNAVIQILNEVLARVMNSIPELAGQPVNNYTQKLQDIQKNAPEFARQIQALQEDKSMPTYQDKDLVAKIGQCTHIINWHAKHPQNLENMPHQLADLEALENLDSTQPEKQEAAGQHFLHRFMEFGVYDAYPDYFKPVLADQQQEIGDWIQNKLKRVIWSQSPETGAYIYKCAKLSSPQAIMKNLLEMAKNVDIETLNENLPPRVRVSKDEMRPLTVIAFAIDNAQKQLATAHTFDQMENVPEELNTAFEQIYSETPEEWLKGIAYFGTLVDQQF